MVVAGGAGGLGEVHSVPIEVGQSACLLSITFPWCGEPRVHHPGPTLESRPLPLGANLLGPARHGATGCKPGTAEYFYTRERATESRIVQSCVALPV